MDADADADAVVANGGLVSPSASLQTTASDSIDVDRKPWMQSNRVCSVVGVFGEDGGSFRSSSSSSSFVSCSFCRWSGCVGISGLVVSDSVLWSLLDGWQQSFVLNEDL